jgi:hypothetical protein
MAVGAVPSRSPPRWPRGWTTRRQDPQACASAPQATSRPPMSSCSTWRPGGCPHLADRLRRSLGRTAGTGTAPVRSARPRHRGDVPWTNRACGAWHRPPRWHLRRDRHRARHPRADARAPSSSWASLADPTRSMGGSTRSGPAHVPAATPATPPNHRGPDQRFAPGVCRIVAASPALRRGHVHNPNYVGGDILTGANTTRQV